MKNKAHDLSKYQFSQGEDIYLDANIWLYLFPAPNSPQNNLTKIYSAALKGILSAKANIFITSTILSEYLNRYCRIEWEALHKGKYNTFKSFRQSPDYMKVGNQAGQFASSILSLCSRKNCGFDAANIKGVLSLFQQGQADFNDGLIIDACIREKWKLVTHDGDFVHGGINILTSNRKLLTACP